MLQRNTDSSADYGTPLVVSKKGWWKKFFDHQKIAENIPVITSKVPAQSELWSKLKYLARIETPIRIVGVVVLGTLLGAAYAVTIKSSDKQNVKLPVSAISSQEMVTQELTAESVMPIANELSTPSLNTLSNESEASNTDTLQEAAISDVMNEFSFSQVATATTTPEANDKVILTLKSPEINQDEIKVASAFKLVSTEKSFKITHPKGFNPSKRDVDEATYSAIVIPEELVPDVTEEAGLSEYEQQKIMELEKKLALAQKKLDRFNMENLKLQGKFETLVVKNRALSDQLRHIDTVTTALKGH